MHTNALTTLLFKLDTISRQDSTNHDLAAWRDSVRAAGHGVRESCIVDLQTAQAMLANIDLVLAFFERDSWNHTTLDNFTTVRADIHDKHKLTPFALHAFLEALRDLRRDQPELGYQSKWQQANIALRDLIRDTKDNLVVRYHPT